MHKPDEWHTFNLAVLITFPAQIPLSNLPIRSKPLNKNNDLDHWVMFIFNIKYKKQRSK